MLLWDKWSSFLESILPRLWADFASQKEEKESSEPYFLQDVILPQEFMRETSVARLSMLFAKPQLTVRALLEVASPSQPIRLRTRHIICRVPHAFSLPVRRHCDIFVASIQTSAE